MGYTKGSADRLYQEQQMYADLHKRKQDPHPYRPQPYHHRSSPNISGLPDVPYTNTIDKGRQGPSFAKRYPGESKFEQKLHSIQRRHHQQAEVKKSKSFQELSHDFLDQQYRDEGSILEVRHVKAKRPSPITQNENYLTQYSAPTQRKHPLKQHHSSPMIQRNLPRHVTKTQSSPGHRKTLLKTEQLDDYEPDSLNDSYVPKLEAYKAKVRAAKQALLQDSPPLPPPKKLQQQAEIPPEVTSKSIQT